MNTSCWFWRTAVFMLALAGLVPGIDQPALSATEKAFLLCEPAPLPKSLTLCGERVPLEDARVQEMLERELLISVWDRAQAFLWFKRAARYFPHIEKKLSEAGMPADLKYLSVAESALIPTIRSRAGALGTWQFMAATGEQMGLRRDQSLDERMDFERATQAALLYLRQLHKMFGSWITAMAAYNCGENRVKNEMKEQRVTNYYRLDLPPETERYVFRIAAIKLIMENPRLYGFSIARDQLYPPIPYDAVPVSVRAPVHIADVAEGLGTDYKMIRELNPQLLGRHLPTGSYVMKVPRGSGNKLNRLLARHNALAQPPGGETENAYTVKTGDTLIEISRQTGVPLDTLKRLNRLQDSHISPGQKLRLSP